MKCCGCYCGHQTSPSRNPLEHWTYSSSHKKEVYYVAAGGKGMLSNGCDIA